MLIPELFIYNGVNLRGRRGARPKAPLSAGPEGRGRALGGLRPPSGLFKARTSRLKPAQEPAPAPPLRAPFLKAPAGRAAPLKILETKND